MSSGYNPEFQPNGIEGGIDTNGIPWIDLPQAPGMAIKPLRASTESSMFTVFVKLTEGTELSGLIYLGAMDMMVLSGSMTYPDGPMAGNLEPAGDLNSVGIMQCLPATLAFVSSILDSTLFKIES